MQSIPKDANADLHKAMADPAEAGGVESGQHSALPVAARAV